MWMRKVGNNTGTTLDKGGEKNRNGCWEREREMSSRQRVKSNRGLGVYFGRGLWRAEGGKGDTLTSALGPVTAPGQVKVTNSWQRL